MSFWNVIWFIIVSFALIAYLMVVFRIIVDLFHDKSQTGWGRVLWLVFLIFVPPVGGIAYLIVHGTDMTERSMMAADAAQDARDAYIREAAATSSPTEQIATAKALLDAGTITQDEYEALKAKAGG